MRRQRFEGPTLLVAAMRCYVASKLGAEIEVPDSWRDPWARPASGIQFASDDSTE